MRKLYIGLLTVGYVIRDIGAVLALILAGITVYGAWPGDCNGLIFCNPDPWHSAVTLGWMAGAALAGLGLAVLYFSFRKPRK